jgi:polysaccharide biosynthesis/export protein
MFLKCCIVFLGLALTAAFSGTTFDASRPGDSYVLGPNDRVTLRCLNAEELPSTPIRIDGDGQVTLPFAGRIKLAGLSVAEAEKEVTERLAKYILHPQVALTVVESHSQPVSVFGAVNNPGVYQLEGEKTLSEILSMAGGLRRDAGPSLKITRRTAAGTIPLPSVAKDVTGVFNVANIDLDDFMKGNSPAANIDVKPYDVVSVPPAAVVYVVGQVRKAGGFTMTGRDGLSVLQALSMAEGLDRNAAPKKARILRRTAGAGRQDIAVNLQNLLEGKLKDMPLQADDVLFVPNNAAKSAGNKTLDAIIQAATGVVIYGRY